MYDPNARQTAGEPTQLAAAATTAAPTANPANRDSAVVDKLAWSEEEPGSGVEPMPFVEDPYDAPPSGRVPVVPPPPGRPARGRRVPQLVIGLGALVALIAAIGAIYSLLRSSGHEAPSRPASDVDVPAAPESSALPTTSTVPSPVAPAPTTEAPPPVTEEPVTSTAAPEPTTTHPVTTTPPTTTPPPTTPPPTTTVPTTTTAPTTTGPPTTSAPPSTTEQAESPVSTPPTMSMTTEYLRIPLVPIPIPIQVPAP